MRAARRHQELRDRGEPSIYARVLADIEARDARDAGRADAPMRKAEDAVEIDTSDLSPSEVFTRALAVIEAAVSGIERRTRPEGRSAHRQPTRRPRNSVDARHRRVGPPAKDRAHDLRQSSSENPGRSDPDIASRRQPDTRPDAMGTWSAYVFLRRTNG
ncbi:MAG: (d)CMP kinase [Thalassobaculum sp.]